MLDQLRTYRNNPLDFIGRLTIPAANGPRRFSDVWADFQVAAFRALSPSLVAVARGRKPAVPRYWLERSKGSAKDSDLAACLTWLLVFGRPGLAVQVAAVDQDQAAELRKAVKDLERLNPWLAKILDVQVSAVVNRRTESRADILTADVPSSHGARPDVLIANEVSHIPPQRWEFVENLFDNLAKKPRGLGVILTNAGFKGSPAWRWRENARESPRWWFQQVTHPAPWIDPAELAEAESRNPPSRFKRLWRGVWSTGEGDALEESWIDAACTLAGPAFESEPGFVYCGGLDLSLRSDWSALAIVGKSVGWTERIQGRERRPVTRLQKVLEDIDIFQDGGGSAGRSAPEVKHVEHPGTGEVKLVALRVWKPTPGREVDLGEVERAVVEADRRFPLRLLFVDEWQSAFLVRRLRDARINAETLAFSGGVLEEMAGCVLNGFRDGKVKVFPDEDLLRDLRNMMLVERSYGVRLESPRGKHGHGDLVTALALALLAAKRIRRGGPILLRRPLLCASAASVQ